MWKRTILPVALAMALLSQSGGAQSHESHDAQAELAESPVGPALLGTFAAPGDFAGGQPLQDIPQRVSKNGRLDVDLYVQYAEYDLDTGEEPLPVRLRSYVDPTLKNPDGTQMVGPWGPTLRVKPSDRLTITIHNRLPAAPHNPVSDKCKFPPKPGDHNYPHDFNVTNLHTHGLHVSPAEDDVLREVKPTYSSRYHYELDKHAPGTHWYHPHVHGSTAMQVSSGMAGMLIVDPEKPEFPGIEERILIFNQFVVNKKASKPPYGSEDFNYAWDSPTANPFPTGTTINGQVKPVIEVDAGEVQRWRFLNTGFDKAIRFIIQREDDPQDILDLYQISVDGIFFDEVRTTKDIAMAPGNRTDLFFKALKPGVYLMRPQKYDPEYEYDLGEKRPIKTDESKFLATIVVKDSQQDMKVPTALPSSGHKITDAPIDTRKVHFSVERVKDESPLCPSYWSYRWGIGGKRFDPWEIPHQPVVGTVEDWHLTADPFKDDNGKTFSLIHPFHIHVNPFLVQEINGKKLLKPMWKDVVVVRSTPQGVRLRTQYVRYTGDFVMHCHILAHEDVGMMQRVRIVKPEKEEEQEEQGAAAAPR